MANNRELSQFANVVGYNGGSIGIGTDNPDATLKVNVASGNNGVVVQNTSTANIALFGARNGDATLQAGQFGSTASGTTFGLSNANLAFVYTTSYNTTHPSALALGNVSNKPIVFATNNTERARINSSGEVYIGSSTADGQGKLFVNDSSGATTTRAHIRNAVSNGNAETYYNLDGSKFASVGLENGSLVFRNSTSSTPTERLRIDSAGNMGLGTNNPNDQTSGGYTSFTVNDSSGGIIDLRRGDVALSGGRLVGLQHEFGLEARSQDSSSQISFYVNNAYTGRWTVDGLCFGSDTAAANALDDYEEGTWTPTVTSGASSLTVTTASCMYTKVGKLVTLQFEVRNPTSVTSDAFKLGGLPYSFDDQTVGSVMVHSVNFDTGRTMVTLYGYSSELRFYGSGDSVAWEVLHGDDITTSATIIGTISYRVA